jgi:hypothetical protein
MLIGTLSTKRTGARQALSGKERLDCIVHVVSKFKPHLLVCAGDALASKADLNKLSHNEQITRSRTTIVIEVEGSIYILRRGTKTSKGKEQVFAVSSEVRGEGEDATSTRKIFERELANRVFKVKNKSVLVLNCGEINILSGFKQVRCESRECEEAISRADIIVNPTHDLMGNGGILSAKRKYLSRRVDARNRLYVSSSNWNTRKKRKRKNKEIYYICQKRDAPTLHDYFLSGKQLKIKDHIERHSEDPRFEYRQAEIDL